MRRPGPLKALPPVPGWPRSRIEARLPSPARRSEADQARFWVDLDPPLDPAALPAVLQTDRPALTRCWGRRLLYGAAVVLMLSAAAGLVFAADTPWDEVLLSVLLLPAVLALLGAALLMSVRGQPDALRLELSQQRVRFSGPSAPWEEPLSAYDGLALRRCVMRDPTRRRHRHASRTESALGMDRRVERWWIELVHDNPLRTVVLWASDQPMDDGLERVEAWSTALDLPILTTSNRYWIADGEDAEVARSHLPRPSIPLGIPRLLALIVMLPLTLATAWLGWTVAQQSVRVVQTWQPVQVTLLDKSASDTLRLAIVDAQGQRREADVPRTTDLRAHATGETFAAYADPDQPDVLRPASGASLWAGVGMLAFFALAFAGSGLFLWRSRPLPR